MVPLPAKVEAINKMPRPTTKVELLRFLGCINFFHRFLPNIASTLAPLHALTASANTPKSVLTWSDTQDGAFAASKVSLTSSVRLAHPDPSACLSLTTDASMVAVGAVLTQDDLTAVSYTHLTLPTIYSV